MEAKFHDPPDSTNESPPEPWVQNRLTEAPWPLLLASLERLTKKANLCCICNRWWARPLSAGPRFLGGYVKVQFRMFKFQC